MTYKTKLHPWCIIRPLPNLQYRFIARFRSRSDAEGHLRILRLNNPTASYDLIFDVTPDFPLLAGEGQGERLTNQSEEMELKQS
jgi:hypothetical protein